MKTNTCLSMFAQLCFYANVMSVDILDVFLLYIVGTGGKASSGAGVSAE